MIAQDIDDPPIPDSYLVLLHAMCTLHGSQFIVRSQVQGQDRDQTSPLCYPADN